MKRYQETLLNLSSPQAFHFATYEAAMHWLNPEKSYNPYHHALAGAAAGGVGATVALPLDACKTLLNTQEVVPVPAAVAVPGLFYIPFPAR